ncbi:MAG: hypothetical protein EOP04_03400 [Proteobacteria bacterium]|nr:MAG: hypothetical protein EOP04_03400 [Pseudomonadota bacterium]
MADLKRHSMMRNGCTGVVHEKSGAAGALTKGRTIVPRLVLMPMSGFNRCQSRIAFAGPVNVCAGHHAQQQNEGGHQKSEKSHQGKGNWRVRLKAKQKL